MSVIITCPNAPQDRVETIDQHLAHCFSPTCKARPRDSHDRIECVHHRPLSICAECAPLADAMVSREVSENTAKYQPDGDIKVTARQAHAIQVVLWGMGEYGMAAWLNPRVPGA